MPKNNLIAKIREFTGHDHIQVLPSGNAAIMAAVYVAKKVNKKAFFLIPDQGGWLTYKEYPEMFGIQVQEIKTKDSIFDLEDLKKHVSSGTALIYSNPAGYFAEQPAKQIFDICKKAKCLVIMDVSGSFGNGMCSGDCADILVCSFGKWKVVDNGYGGFVSAREKGVFDEGKVFYKMMKVSNCSYKCILEKIDGLRERWKLLLEAREKVLKDLAEMDIVYPEKKGINVVVRFKDLDEKDKILKYCKNNNLEYTECPRYIRIDDKAISIEIKRLG
ncbi:MAG: hypothetical protein KAT77_04395 [Nanoarchaeota archaeon]|nr:hypothetical protein [Nanoarchaeota archaeon]